MDRHYYDREHLAQFPDIGKNSPELAAKFFDWYNAVFADGALSAREKAIVALVVAHAVQCPYCIDAYSRGALEQGADLDQMTEAIHVAAAIRGGAALVHGLQMRGHAAAPLEREFGEAIAGAGLPALTPSRIDVLQINLGKFCNQTCRHCHVDAGPDRTDEMMTRETMALCLDALDRARIPTVDITGGAPELHPHFRWLVEACRARGRHVIDRCNLTVLALPSQDDLAEFLAQHQVEVVCSLPHYRAPNTDRQRGDGVYEKSVAALKRLNALGYGDGASGLRLVLVTNPPGAVLPGSQRSLEAEWKRELLRLHRIRFDALYCLANMPIGRFLEWLDESGNLESYVQRLAASFNPAAVEGLMCRTTISVGWDGRLYDCDFNQMLGVGIAERTPRHIRDFDPARGGTSSWTGTASGARLARDRAAEAQRQRPYHPPEPPAFSHGAASRYLSRGCAMPEAASLLPSRSHQAKSCERPTPGRPVERIGFDAPLEPAKELKRCGSADQTNTDFDSSVHVRVTFQH